MAGLGVEDEGIVPQGILSKIDCWLFGPKRAFRKMVKQTLDDCISDEITQEKRRTAGIYLFPEYVKHAAITPLVSDEFYKKTVREILVSKGYEIQLKNPPDDRVRSELEKICVQEGVQEEIDEKLSTKSSKLYRWYSDKMNNLGTQLLINMGMFELVYFGSYAIPKILLGKRDDPAGLPIMAAASLFYAFESTLLYSALNKIKISPYKTGIHDMLNPDEWKHNIKDLGQKMLRPAIIQAYAAAIWLPRHLEFIGRTLLGDGKYGRPILDWIGENTGLFDIDPAHSSGFGDAFSLTYATAFKWWVAQVAIGIPVTWYVQNKIKAAYRVVADRTADFLFMLGITGHSFLSQKQ